MVISNIQKRQNIDYSHMFGDIARMNEIPQLLRSNSLFFTSNHRFQSLYRLFQQDTTFQIVQMYLRAYTLK